MKKIFEILQKPWCPVILGILFMCVPKWTKDFGLIATWVILVVSIIVLLLVLWNTLSKWGVKKQGYLIANIGAAFTGIASSLMILAYANGDLTDQELNLLLLISFCFGITLFGWGIFNQWVVKPWKEDKGTASPTETRP